MSSGRVIARSRFPALSVSYASVLIAFFLIAGGGHGWAASLERLEIATKSGPRAFSVELATTDDERSTGLMYRTDLPEGQGMLFDFSPPQLVSMWMKNTPLALDMIFIQADGRILRIAQNAEPLSTIAIPSGGVVKGVLELVGGSARKYGISPGDRVSHRFFGSGH
jgi:uncharacterized membrane protein (UPF0127 family)